MGAEGTVTTKAPWRNWAEKRPHLVPSLIAGLMLLAALGDWPYGYYQFLRFVVCGVGGYVAWLSYESKRIWAAWLFGLVAVLFNPLVPFHLSREIWQPLDLACAALFLAGAFVSRRTEIGG